MDLACRRTAAVQAALIAGGATGDQILVRNVGEENAGPEAAWCRVDAQVGTQEMQNSGLHETGYMLGSDDEYLQSGAPAGTAVAADYDAMIQAQTGDVVTRGRNADAMSLGSTVRQWNYAAFLEALEKMTGEKGLGRSEPWSSGHRAPAPHRGAPGWGGAGREPAEPRPRDRRRPAPRAPRRRAASALRARHGRAVPDRRQRPLPGHAAGWLRAARAAALEVRARPAGAKSSDGLGQLRRALDEAGFFSLPGRIDSGDCVSDGVDPQQRPQGPQADDRVLHARNGGREATVEGEGDFGAPCTLAELEPIYRALDLEALGDWQNE